jgi:hypothetical protein
MQSLTELRLALAALQDHIGGFQVQIDACVEFLDALTGGPIPLPKRGRYKKVAKTNGSAGKAISPEVFREKVRHHYKTNRPKASRTHPKHALSLDAALDAARRKHKGVADPSPDTLTTAEVAKRLRMSDAGVRNLVSDGRLPEPSLELRRFGQFHAFRPSVVHRLTDIEAYSVGQLNQGPPARRVRIAVTTKAMRPAKKLSKVAQRRLITAAFLAKFSPGEPRKIPGGKGLGPLVRRGYLRKLATGYVRTSMAFDPYKTTGGKPSGAKTNATTKPKRPWNKEAVQAKRQATLATLAKFDTEEVRPSSLAENHRVIGVMVQHGYLRAKQGGYVRTGKEYQS